jgi:hypothetical protein
VGSAAYCILLGQTLVSVAYGAVAYLFARRSSWRGSVFLWSAVILIAFLIGVARIYLGTDWLTDVLSRWALALLWLSAALVVVTIVEQASGARIAPAAEPHPSAIEEVPPQAPSISVIRRPEISIEGLGESEIAERRKRGEVNIVDERTSRTVVDILKANAFTRFNALLGGLFVIILLISGKEDALFGLILIANTAIGVVQELRAKRTLDRLRVLFAPRAHVVRDGLVRDISSDQIVLDDVLELRPGDQLPVDGVLLAAQNFRGQ